MQNSESIEGTKQEILFHKKESEATLKSYSSQYPNHQLHSWHRKQQMPQPSMKVENDTNTLQSKSNTLR